METHSSHLCTWSSVSTCKAYKRCPIRLACVASKDAADHYFPFSALQNSTRRCLLQTVQALLIQNPHQNSTSIMIFTKNFFSNKIRFLKSIKFHTGLRCLIINICKCRCFSVHFGKSISMQLSWLHTLSGDFIIFITLLISRLSSSITNRSGFLNSD